MIQAKENLVEQVNVLKELVKGVVKIQKIYSTPHFICITMRAHGATNYVYLGRGKSYQGLWVHNALPPSITRIQDPFLFYLRKYLISTQLLNVVLLNDCFGLIFEYGSNLGDGKFLFIYHNSLLYYSHLKFSLKNLNESEIFCSWVRGKISYDNQSGEDFYHYIKNNFNGGFKNSSVIVSPFVEFDSILKMSCEKFKGKTIEKKSKKFLIRKITNIKNDLEKNSCWKKLEDEITKLDQIEESKIDVQIFLNEINKNLEKKIKYYNFESFFQLKNRVYFLIKKMKNGEVILKKRLEQTKIEFEKFENEITTTDCKFISKEEINKHLISPALPELKTEKINKKIREQNNIDNEYFKFKLKSGKIFCVGRSAKGNDYLRKTWANDNDFWFHIENSTSTHLFLKCESLDLLSDDDWMVLASVIAKYSNYFSQKVPLIYTQVKNLKAVKGELGKVIYKKNKFRMVNVIENWEENLLPII